MMIIIIRSAEASPAQAQAQGQARVQGRAHSPVRAAAPFVAARKRQQVGIRDV